LNAVHVLNDIRTALDRARVAGVVDVTPLAEVKVERLEAVAGTFAVAGTVAVAWAVAVARSTVAATAVAGSASRYESDHGGGNEDSEGVHFVGWGGFGLGRQKRACLVIWMLGMLKKLAGLTDCLYTKFLR